MQLTLAIWGVADDADKVCICLVTLSAMYAPVDKVDERYNSQQQSNYATVHKVDECDNSQQQSNYATVQLSPIE